MQNNIEDWTKIHDCVETYTMLQVKKISLRF